MSGSEATLPLVEVTAKRDLPEPSRPPTPGGGPTPYAKRRIDVTFKLGTGAFGEQGSTTVTLRGHRCSVTVEKAAASAQTACHARIWGMLFSQMQKLSTLGEIYAARKDNQILIEAGDDVAGMSRVFAGTITEAFFDGENQPDVAFQVTAFAGAFELIKPAPPISIAGAVDVATVMQTLATQMGVEFENHGVNVKLRDVYYPGTAWHQMRRLAEHAGINALLDDGTLAIWPRGVARGAGTVPLITMLNGMKNYPTFNSMGITVSCLFNVALVFGARVAVQSSLWDNQTKYYYVGAFNYNLESEMPGGAWFATFQATVEPLGAH